MKALYVRGFILYLNKNIIIIIHLKIYLLIHLISKTRTKYNSRNDPYLYWIPLLMHSLTYFFYNHISRRNLYFYIQLYIFSYKLFLNKKFRQNSKLREFREIPGSIPVKYFFFWSCVFWEISDGIFCQIAGSDRHVFQRIRQ